MNVAQRKRVLIYPQYPQTKKHLIFMLFIFNILTMSVLLLKTEANVVYPFVFLGLISALGLSFCVYVDKPQVSFSLTYMHIQQHTKMGGWCVKWSQIQEIGIPSVSYEGWHQPLPLFGVKLKDYGPLLENISLRLASHILIEQRGLLLKAYRNSDTSQKRKMEDIMFDDKPYRASNGTEYDGLLAMLANRMVYTRECLGFDVMIHEDLLDRPLEDFVGFTRRYLADIHD